MCMIWQLDRKLRTPVVKSLKKHQMLFTSQCLKQYKAKMDIVAGSGIVDLFQLAWSKRLSTYLQKTDQMI